MRKASSRCWRDDKRRRIIKDDMLWALNTPLLKLATPRSVYNNAAIRRTSSLPVNVIESHVLPNLSFGTILRLKCVSKEWNKFFSSTYLHF